MALSNRIELVLSDVDGVLTDGGILLDNQGIESKRFHIRDGMGVRLWQMAGFDFGLITARTSQVVKLRAAELDIGTVRQGVKDKRAAAEEVAKSKSLSPEQVCFIGDDLPDIGAILWAGLGVSVADGAPEARAAADHITQLGGGQGAVRELLEALLRSSDRWDDLVQRFVQ